MTLTKTVLGGAAWTGEKVVSKLAVPIAVCSMNEPYHFLLRPIGGTLDTAGLIYGVASPLITNTGFRDVVGGVVYDVGAELGGAAEAFASDPWNTGLTAVYAYGLCKLGIPAAKRLKRSLTKKKKQTNSQQSN